jgi:hypothetical protein
MNPQLNAEPSSRIRRGIAFGLSFFSLLSLLFVGAWTWLFRDGMGPDSIESSGWKALRRFSSDFWPIAAFCFILFGIAFLIAPRQTRPRNASTNATGQV